MAGDLEGRVALVTGAARGLGRAIALELAAGGADVAVADVGRPDPLVPYPLALPADLVTTAAQVEESGRRAMSVTCDVSVEEEVEALVATVLRAFDRIDVLVANAGVLMPRHLAWEIPATEWDRVLAVNLTGVWLCCKYVVPRMIELGRGRIVLVASTAALRASPGFAGYAAAKCGVVGLTRCLAAELASHGITVNAVCPGPTDTPMLRNDAVAHDLGVTSDGGWSAFADAAALLPGGLLTPAVVAHAVAWLASDLASHVTGHALPVDAGSAVA